MNKSSFVIIWCVCMYDSYLYHFLFQAAILEQYNLVSLSQSATESIKNMNSNPRLCYDVTWLAAVPFRVVMGSEGA